MSKRKNKSNNNSQESLKIELDYDKLAEAIVKANAKITKEKEQNIEREFEERLTEQKKTNKIQTI